MKTDTTKQAEMLLWRDNRKMGNFGCFEVSIGFNDDYRGCVERVDFITYDTKGVVRCFEIKVSKSDLNSKAKKSFIGDFNYYVMPVELWESLQSDKDFMWHVRGLGVGVYSFTSRTLECVLKPKKKQVSMGLKVTVLESMVRSLNREVAKFYKDTPYWS